jgi:two-component system cell cycle sensor histidine kinase/response regulator CckA
LPKLKILVVEDERIVATDIQSTLINLGYEVPAIVSTGQEALHKVETLKPDLILMDIMLKGNMDGIECARRINETSRIPIIYLTAYEDKETLDRAKVTQPLGYILKPFEERNLHSTLETALYKHSMEEKLRESEERYRRLVEHSPYGIAVELDLKLIFINPTAAKMLGEPKEEKLLGRPFTCFIPEEDHELIFQKIKYINESHSPLPSLEGQFKRIDGTCFDVDVAMLPFPYENRMATQIIFRDITLRKKAETELKYAYDELKRTQQALIQSEKLTALGRFSAGIAHEIRNPLANISASAQFCMSKYDVANDMKKHFEVILRNTENANRTIKELLDFTSPRGFSMNPGNIGKIIYQVSDLVKPRCEKQKIQLFVDIKDNLPLTLLNEKKLEEAFMNFVSNSIDAMPKGGVLTISAERSSSDNILVSFKDTGHGISQQDMDKIFEPFFTTKDEGTGLGLSLAYNIITAHSGEMTVKSRKNEGTVIQINFPVRKDKT